ncbi:tyrosine-protein phosphatase [Streptacidiphilus neutrinimicus]|uniref:tyrosine-protein phosphatase n=1 Tax=Streptacidiphilus neutrinimicus TaxID=105420 RepID=UPI0005AA02DB|nr:tyrosine-protein phosphatase [Streptacidiphilus neutrinimicus]
MTPQDSLVDAGADRVPGRSLGLQCAVNARDLGGYRTADGRTVRLGVALRGDALHRATDEDLAALEGLGLRHVIDLRGTNEVDENGADRLPAGVALEAQPVFATDHDIYASLRDTLAAQDGDAQRALLGDGGAERMMISMYGWFVTDPEIRGRFAATVKALARPENLPLFFHCTAGKDRTGWTAAIVLTALGVDRATVYEDYLLTNERTDGLIARILAHLGTQGVMREPELMRPVMRADRAYLDASFAAVEAGWPTFDAFLHEGLGLTEAELEGLRKNLLD